MTSQSTEIEVLKAKLAIEIENHKASLQRDLENFKAGLQGSLKQCEEDNIRSRVGWQHLLEGQLVGFRGVLEFAQLAIRSLFIANGGAILAILTFVGNLWAKDKAGPLAGAMLQPMQWFMAGTALALTTALVSYLSQVAFIELPRRDGQRTPLTAIWLRWVAIGAGAGSLAAFCTGAFMAARAFAA